ncbi:nucleoporin p58/p45-like [Rhopilema esculentum]|uniref:nucleoporin p58/p45-like n=1 Tax=Rhopilema esculentum TaxID=499914 RepID=UPI0031D46042|eukprot:gene618-10312_t
MAAASGTFGGSGLFGAASSGTPAFGTNITSQPSSTGFSFGGIKPTTTSSVGFTFGASQTPALSSTGQTSLGFGGFGTKPAASVSAFSATASTTQSTQPTGLGFLSTGLNAASTSSTLGGGLFGAKMTVASSIPAAPFQLSSGTGSLFGNTSSALGLQMTAGKTTSNVGEKAPENPKDEQVAQPLMQVYQEVSKHIKDQRAKKDEIARYSAKLILKATEEIAALKQSLAEVSNGMQRDAVGIEGLKGDVTQELNNASLARRLHEIPASFQHDYSAPIEYFCSLVFSFETRVKLYRQQLDELETYLSATTPVQNFNPQDLLSVLRQLNDTFVGLAAQLQGIHEAVQSLKSKYLQYRRVVLNDNTDIFGYKYRNGSRDDGQKGSGPSPFAGLAGPSAVAMAAALNQTTTGGQSTVVGGSFGINKIGQSSLAKSSGISTTGMSRSLSFSGLSSRGAGTSLSLGTGSSLIGSSLGSSLTGSLFAKPGSSTTSQFQLQNPPGTKRGKKD